MTQVGQIDAPAPATNNNGFGTSLSASGEWAIVGAPGNDQLATDAGAAYILHRANGAWAVVQTPLSPPGTPTPAGDKFGTTVAMFGSTAIVGSPFEQVNAAASAGAAHVYVLQDGTWSYLQRVTAPDAQANDQFGTAVAIDNDVLIVGAPWEDQAMLNAGAAYVYRWNSTTWQFQQKLIQTDEPADDHFGSSVSASGSAVAIGAPFRTVSQEGGAAYVYRFDGTTWNEEQRFLPPSPSGLGRSIGIDGNHLAIGGPGFTNPQANGMNHGSVLTFAYDGKSWVAGESFAGTSEWGQLGTSLSLQAGLLAVGARSLSVAYAEFGPTCQQGGVFTYRLEGSNWIADLLYLKNYVPNNQSDCQSMWDFLGASVAMSGEEVLAGADWGIGSVFVFCPDNVGCQLTGMPGECADDCNDNDVDDACELADGTSLDCNLNNVPDECESDIEYEFTTSQGGQCYGSLVARDFAWLGQFNVNAGGQNITHIGVKWCPYTVPGSPATVVVFDDPDNDGHPADAHVVATAPAHSILAFNSALLPYSYFAVPTANVGTIGDSFFIGVFMTLTPDTFAALQSGPSFSPSRGWYAASPPGTLDLNNLTAAEFFVSIGGAWTLSALALDCDGNGVWDQCDIDGDPSLDLNNNGIIDSCDLPCPGDIAGPPGSKVQRNGAVDIDDLLVVVNHWGQTGPPGTVPGDIFPQGVGDGIVNIDDLLLLVNTWGVCP